MPEIHRLLITTTAHVTGSEASVLDQHGYSRGEYGWLIHVGPKPHSPIPEIQEPSQGLKGVIEQAHQYACEYVLLDPDGDSLPGLPVYDWI